MTTEQILIKALLVNESCDIICRHGYRYKGYPECHMNWCDNYKNFQLDIDKVKREYRIDD